MEFWLLVFTLNSRKMPKKTHVKKTTETALQHQQPPPVGGGEGGGGGLPQHRRKKKAHRGQLRFPCLPAITAIKHRMVLEAFATVFEQFPLKIAELATLKGSGQYVMHRTDVYTDPSAFLGPVPPSLKAILKQQQEEEESKSKGENSGTCPVSAVCCNWNRQVPLFVTYDGYIEANNHLLEVASKLESYCDFYVSWFVQWANAVKLMKPEAQEEKALETDVQEAVMATLEDIYGSISS